MASVPSPVAILTASNPLISKELANNLLFAANEIKARAYCPYSKFPVGAAILALPASADGLASNATPVLFSGVNVENASYPVGTCAERVALGSAITAGYHRVIAMAVSTDISPPASPASPCGMCRQFIREFLINGDVVIVMMGSTGTAGAIWRKFGDLLPLSFGPEDLPDTTEASVRASN